MDALESQLEDYQRQGIPSSHRVEPSGSVQDFVLWLREQAIKDGHALDIGTGHGRNSIFLAKQGFEVTGLDYMTNNCEIVRAKAEAEQLPINAICHDIKEPWPVNDNSVDIVIDTFCFKHQIDPEAQKFYVQELYRVMKPGAFYLMTLVSRNDGYYGDLDAIPTENGEYVVTDPVLGVHSRIYTEQEVLDLFADQLMIVESTVREKEELMYGEYYRRETLMFIMQK